MPPAPPVGPVVKTVPPPFKVTAKQDGTGWKIEVPLYEVELKGMFGKQKLTLVLDSTITPFPKPGKQYIDPSIGLSLKWTYGRLPRR